MVMHARPTHWQKTPYSLIFLLAGAACTGRIGETTASSLGGPNGGAGAGGGSTSPTPGTPGTGGPGTPTGGGGSGLSCPTGGETTVAFRVLSRLNRVEYDNTVRDLLGDTSHTVLSHLPVDFGDGGFDNNAAALSIDPALSQTYVQLAETLAENAMAPGSAGRAHILSCATTDDACARQIANTLGSRAFRRPLAAGEADRLLALYTAARVAGFSFEQGIQTLVEGVLLSPNFLFRPEIDPTIDSPSQHPVSGYELATRLSYFLWSSMPDDALTTAAGNGTLVTADGLRREVQRMWSNPKAETFFARFPGLWLRTQDLTIANQPAINVYPQFNPTLESAMESETALFMRELMTSDASFLDFLDAPFTYVNQPLAQFYGISGNFGSDFTRVDLTGNAQRGGILTQGSVLTATSAPERTSPARRGQWVLARILASPPPPPPANIPPISSSSGGAPMTFREKFEAHVANPVCAGCHNLMDPIGFGLENYNGIGQWRTTDNGQPVDASGQLNGGQSFSGALELEHILKTDPRVPNAVVQYLVAYALGREVGADDACAVQDLSTAFQTEDTRMSALVQRVAGMDAMSIRRGSPE